MSGSININTSNSPCGDGNLRGHTCGDRCANNIIQPDTGRRSFPSRPPVTAASPASVEQQAKRKGTVTVDGRRVPVTESRNLLDLIRSAGVEIPTFCYHSELSVYGACRLCLVDIEGRGVVTSCSTTPEDGMVIRTSTPEIRELRKMTVELLLAGHQSDCTVCTRSDNCKLRELARGLGIRQVRFTNRDRELKPVDCSSDSLVRDPNKCILCGDCVRYCTEIQGVGAIDFANRGVDAAVVPAFGKELAKVECVDCGQCAAVCPTAAIVPKTQTDQVWGALENADKEVVVQVAPAVRVALGEAFGMKSGTEVTGKMVAALRRLGFQQVFDTAFAADLTVIEEGTELGRRLEQGERLPLFTSCCPAWVKYAEQYYPTLLQNLSSCRSPQQSLGALLKDDWEREGGQEGGETEGEERSGECSTSRRDLVVVSVMPCTAKKYEARRPEFGRDGVPDVDYVLTTQELADMVIEAGIVFDDLEPSPFDMPFGFSTGAGLIFGNSGGVTQAVLRYLSGRKGGRPADAGLAGVDDQSKDHHNPIRVSQVEVDGRHLQVAVVHGLRAASEVARAAVEGRCPFDVVEVMACPGGCVGGAGQPISVGPEARDRRRSALAGVDQVMPIGNARENPIITKLYEQYLGEPNGEKAGNLFHTRFQSRRRVYEDQLTIVPATGQDPIKVKVCVGTSCFLRGAQDLLQRITSSLGEWGVDGRVEVEATFCMEQCDRGPSVMVGEQRLLNPTLEGIREALNVQVNDDIHKPTEEGRS